MDLSLFGGTVRWLKNKVRECKSQIYPADFVRQAKTNHSNCGKIPLFKARVDQGGNCQGEDS